MIFLGIKWYSVIFFGLNDTLSKILVKTIRKQEKVVKLHLEVFLSGNLDHFHLEWCWRSGRHRHPWRPLSTPTRRSTASKM